MFQKTLFVFVLMASGLLVACGGSTSGTPNPTTSSTTINSYDVTGTSAKVSGVAPINAAVNGGVFSVTWNVSSSDPYHVDLYLSSDDVLDTSSSDIKILNQNCGSYAQLYNCNAVGDFECIFNNSNEVSCGTITALNPVKDLFFFLDVIPKDAYLIIKACNSLFSSCETQSVQVQLQ